MKVVETKIYLKFISWFILVSLLPLAILFILIYIFSPQVNLLEDQEVVRAVLIAVFASLAFVFILSLIATRRLSRLITEPIQEAVLDLSKVVENLSKSIENLSDISENNSEISEFLISSSKQQQLGLKSGSVAVAGMVKSLNQIVGKTQSSAKHASDIDKLASQSESKSKLALDSLVSVKNLVTENQKLSQALDAYTKKVKNIYLAFNKPVGITCTTELDVKSNIISFIDYPERIFPVGRLDKPSEGLIFLTNDGDIVNKILRSKNNHDKDYVVTVNKKITSEFIKKMGKGVPILDTVTKKCKVKKINSNTFNIVLTQGLNRQIRRMCEYRVTK